MDTVKSGTRFVHAHWMDEHKRPLVCIVTAVRQGWVYWRRDGQVKPEAKFGEDQVSRYVGEVLS